jgi:IMP dehydrogenase
MFETDSPFELGYDYKDIYIIPQYSEIGSRATVNVTGKIFNNFSLHIPVISANMDTITEYTMATAMSLKGAIGALHRFMPIQENVFEYNRCPKETLVSIGVNGDSEDRADALHKAGARNFIIDVAHGYSKQMHETIRRMKSRYGDVKDNIYIMAGNIATLDAAIALKEWGADAVKVGIGPGAACLTKNVTGVTVPQFSAVYNIGVSPFGIPVIADGGITEIGDIAKAIAAGASAVMCGRLFASCVETPGPRLNGKKIYRGMASKDAMLRIKPSDSLPTAEGASLIIDEEVTNVEDVLTHIKGGLQSAFSYVGAKDMEEFQERVEFGRRK